MYQRIDASEWRAIYIVGDLHGCLRQFAQALREAHFDPWQDLVISVGDLIDRGDNSPGCLALTERRWFRCVLGNHEAMALDALESGDYALWYLNGGSWFTTLNSAVRKRVEGQLLHLRDFPLIIELQRAEQRIVVAHADYPGDHYAWQQPVKRTPVLWSRERLSRCIKGRDESISGADAFYFGHTPLNDCLDCGNLHYIDTGAVFGNRLTLLRVQ
ncbi:metallophosphoesterase [Atlantibacter subterraneus]|uniref:metallophosphoesterase n=2 Tax=Atlantibacter subterraneus TaxID=255519 RepID=UPI002964D9D6|nr:metallophosphoesterase [Atlantibacter subterranea]MDW2744616.1 metallophosphoesterase [Atlantibacter subterranea]